MMPSTASKNNRQTSITWLHYAHLSAAEICADPGKSRLRAISTQRLGAELPANQVTPAASEFLPVLPRNSGFPVSAGREKIGTHLGPVTHSHSIVSGTCKHLKEIPFFSGGIGFTVRYTAEKSRLRAIGSDREGKAPSTLESIRRQIPVSAVTDRRPALYQGVPANDLAWHPDPCRRSDREDPENPLAFVVAVS